MPKSNSLGNVVDNVRDVAGKVVSDMIDALSPSNDAVAVDATTLLKKDHDKVKALFAQADALSDTSHAARLKLFKEIDAELTLHTQVEEQIFYPAFKAKTKRNTDERDEVLEAFEEHAGAKDLIAKLEALDPRDETYKAKLQVLGEMVKHHIDEEESVLFPQAHALLTHAELESLGKQIAVAKQKASGKGPGAKTKRPVAKSSPARGTRAKSSTARTRSTAKKRSR
jgi:iron-sulfur cluster repair protein YtfE (RIC family)